MPDDNVAIMRKAWDAWVRGDLAGLYRYYDDDTIWDLTHFADWPEDFYRGVEAIDRFFRDWLAIWDDYEAGVDDILGAPDGRVVTLYWQRGKGRQSGLPMEWKSAQVATVRDGLITRMDLYDDRSKALEAVGLSG